MPYSEDKMFRLKRHLSDFSPRFLLGILALGTFMAIILTLARAPIWVFYLAPICGVPLLVRELRLHG